MPCLSSSVHTLWQLLQYPVIAWPPFVAYLPESEQALRLGLSDIHLLMYERLLFIITQKDILFIKRMNLYSRDIRWAASIHLGRVKLAEMANTALL
jgi:hypothetical protein